MKKTGQITLVSIVIMIELIEALFLGEFLKRDSIHLLIVVVMALCVGRQYDKMKFYTEE